MKIFIRCCPIFLRDTYTELEEVKEDLGGGNDGDLSNLQGT